MLFINANSNGGNYVPRLLDTIFFPMSLLYVAKYPKHYIYI